MKKFSVVQFLIALLVATQALAGNLTVVGNLTVATNLTTQSITLGGVTQTNWSFLPLQGYKYVIVAEGTNDMQRGSNLKTAYATAVTLGPTSSNRVAVIVPPGTYNLGTTGVVMNTSFVDLVGLVPAHMTAKHVFTASGGGGLRTKTIANVQCPVFVNGTINQTVDSVRIESVILQVYNPSVAGTNTVLRHVSVGSMSGGEYAGEYVDCVGGDNSFGSFDSGGNGGIADGTFIDCVGGYESFGTYQGAASGSFINCTSGDDGFAGNGIASGTFISCVGGDYSFGGSEYANGYAVGTFISCVAGIASFGGDGGSFTGATKIQHCVAGDQSFGPFNVASDDFNYNVGGANTFIMFPQLPTSTNGLPSGTVYNSSGTLKIMP